MTATILDGKAVSLSIQNDIREKVLSHFSPETAPRLCVILVGENPASASYVRTKCKMAEKLGFRHEVFHFDEDVSSAEVEDRIDACNADPECDAVFVQLPLPKHLDENAALAKILPEKDVDGFHLINAGHMLTGTEGVVACTPRGALYMIKSTGLDLNGMEAVVIGRSNIVGKPMAMLLLRENCTVTVCHSRTKNLAEHTRRADILVAAVGKAGFVTADMVKPGAIVIDVGINRVDGKVKGDVDFEAVKEVAGWITPVPGGVGRMTIAMLLANTLEAAEKTAQ